MPDALPSDQPHAARQRWMAVLARAKAEEIADRLAAYGELPKYQRLRGPEAGLVMVRGRAGGGGRAFNLGEMTVTRCSVQTDGFVGHAYVAGRDDRQAELAALVDALLQSPQWNMPLLSSIIEPLAAAQQARRAEAAAKAAATRVEFFAMRNMRT